MTVAVELAVAVAVQVGAIGLMVGGLRQTVEGLRADMLTVKQKLGISNGDSDGQFVRTTECRMIEGMVAQKLDSMDQRMEKIGEAVARAAHVREEGR